MQADAVEIRVLGCLIEKQRTTPDAYPLTLNALRLACNQSTNRDPVVDYDEETIRRRAAAALPQAAGRGSRAARAAAPPSIASWSRGARARRRRDLGAARADAARAADAGRAEAAHRAPAPVRRPRRRRGDAPAARRARPRRPARAPAGQKEERYAQLLGDEVDVSASPATVGRWPRRGPYWRVTRSRSASQRSRRRWPDQGRAGL